MSNYGREYEYDWYRSLSSSLPPEPCLSNFPFGRGDFLDTSSSLNQNPIHMMNHQTSLEEAFSRLSFNQTQSSFDGYNGYPFAPNRFNVELQKLGWYNNNGGAPNCLMGRERNSGFYCFNTLRSPSRVGSYVTSNNGYVSVSPSYVGSSVTSNNGYVSGYAVDASLVSQKEDEFHGGLLNNELSNNKRSNFSGFNVNGRRQRWLQKQYLNRGSIYDFRGRIMLLAKEQCGCRVLQEMMKSLKSQQEISLVFSEMIDNVIELMMDPFGNYVFQKLVEICSEQQMTHIILILTELNFQFVNICLDIHGTRAVQKLLEHVTTQEQRSLIMSALCPGAVALSKDTNGLHVAEHCLKYFSDEDNKYLLNIVASNCFEITTDKSGCCVMQHCVDHAQGETKERLITDIIVNASLLAEDCYGNYVVQHLLSMNIPRITENLMRQLEGKFLLLSCNKYGSNVVEKIFLDSGEQYSTRIILELLQNPNVSTLLVDPFGNFVIKTALSVSKGAIRNVIMELIHLHAPMMRTNIYGKKLLARVDTGRVGRTWYWNYRHWTMVENEELYRELTTQRWGAEMGDTNSRFYFG